MQPFSCSRRDSLHTHTHTTRGGSTAPPIFRLHTKHSRAQFAAVLAHPFFSLSLSFHALRAELLDTFVYIYICVYIHIYAARRTEFLFLSSFIYSFFILLYGLSLRHCCCTIGYGYIRSQRIGSLDAVAFNLTAYVPIGNIWMLLCDTSISPNGVTDSEIFFFKYFTSVSG